MKGCGDQELCLAASPERSYLFRPAVHSLLQPGGLDRERSAFASPPLSTELTTEWRVKKKERHPAHVLPPPSNISLNSVCLLRLISACDGIMLMLDGWIISQVEIKMLCSQFCIKKTKQPRAVKVFIHQLAKDAVTSTLWWAAEPLHSPSSIKDECNHNPACIWRQYAGGGQVQHSSKWVHNCHNMIL